MEIKEAIDYISQDRTDSIKTLLAMSEIFDAIRKGGYTLCKVDEVESKVFEQAGTINERFSADWNKGFDDGMFHTVSMMREACR